MIHTVGVGDLAIGLAGDVLVTHALGSCLGLVAHDPIAKIGGLLHAMLPVSRLNEKRAAENPHMFVDSGFMSLLDGLFALGAQKQRLILKAAGCGSPLGENMVFDVGRRNYEILIKIIEKNSLGLTAESVGGSVSRTVHFEVSSGRLALRIGGREELL
ncbi:MAG: chemotaxis protein CheD [Candidatus Schekmanbacteria bacterium]|nr:chemotaxis protein CheD [Candidatus Schekmanbacteria bacterium]